MDTEKSRIMNAKHLKAAFYYKKSVYSDDKEYPVKLGYVKEVVYSLSKSGKVQCSGSVQPWDNSSNAARVLCRHIHCIDNAQRKLVPKAEPDEHTERIKSAFLGTLPVVANVPNVGTVKGHIKEIVYWRTSKGNIQCSAVILDASCPNSTTRARFKYINVIEEKKG